MKKIDKNDILDQLRRRIITMDLTPGEPLDETLLCQELNISRTPLREILRLLSGEGYIRIMENRGAFVSPMDYHSMRNFFQTAPMIYAAISRLAAERALPADIDRLADDQNRFRDAMESRSVNGMIYYNDRFHHNIGVIADNEFLQPSLQRLLIDHARIGMTFWNSHDETRLDRIRQACADHDRLIEALAANAADSAVEITIEHWQLSKNHSDEFIQPNPLTDADILIAE